MSSEEVQHDHVTTSNTGYDSDEAPPQIENATDKFLWRQDPVDSLSDWTIEINYDKMNQHDGCVAIQTDVYHVHRAILAAGPRRSEYFCRLFKDGGRFAESKDNKSRIHLDQCAAKVFPFMLDYMYSVESELKISTATATALHHLGGYFEIRRLRWDAKQFWQKDLSASTCVSYYERAKLLHDEKIKQAATKKCAEHILAIDTCSRVVHLPDEEFWIQLFEASEINNEFSQHVSKLLGSYFINCGASVEMFQKLTHADCLPSVHRDAAIKLIQAEREIVQPAENKLTDLQGRCIEAIAENWAAFDQISETDMGLLQKQSPFLLTKALAAFSIAAKNSVEERAKELVQEELQRFVRAAEADTYGVGVSYDDSYEGVLKDSKHPQDKANQGYFIETETGMCALYRYS